MEGVRDSTWVGPRARHSARVSWYRAASLSSCTIGTLVVAGEGEVTSMLVAPEPGPGP